ncbi:MAG: rhodanese-like domain-containing protein [Roseiarcus sp.]
MFFSNFFAKPDPNAPPREIGHDELIEAMRDKSVVVVDVREPHEFAGGHLPGAINLPLSRFRLENLPAGKPPVLICLSGARSGSAVRHAHSNGATHVRHYARGMNDWRARGGPIVR